MKSMKVVLQTFGELKKQTQTTSLAQASVGPVGLDSRSGRRDAGASQGRHGHTSRCA